MSNYVFIDGPVLWIIIGFIAFLLLWVMYSSFHCIAVEREKQRFEAENRWYKTMMHFKDSEIKYLKFKLSYRLPRVDENDKQ